MRFDLVDLQLFIHVAETASITRGAGLTNLAPGSASERIRKMEELAGVELLERRQRGVALTAAGRAFGHHASLMLQQMDLLKGELSEYAGRPKGRVRLQANASALSEFLPGALKSFVADHPGIDLDLEEKSSYEIVRSVAGGFIEIGVVADITDFGQLEAYPFATDQLVLIIPRGHNRPTARRPAFQSVLDQDFVGLVATNALQQHLSQRARQAGRPLKLRIRLGSFDAVCRMVAAGIGVAIVPETAARRCCKTTPFRIAELADSWALRKLHVCVRSSSELALPARTLFEHLRGSAKGFIKSDRTRESARGQVPGSKERSRFSAVDPCSAGSLSTESAQEAGLSG